MYLESYTIVAIGAEEEFLPTSVRYGRTELAINVLLQATSERLNRWKVKWPISHEPSGMDQDAVLG